MTKLFVQPGNKRTVIAPAGGVISGVGYMIGLELFVVSQDTVAATLPFVGITEGVHLLTVDAADTAVDGDPAYWDNSAKEVVDTAATGLFKIGTFAEARAPAAGNVLVRLDGIGTPALP